MSALGDIVSCPGTGKLGKKEAPHSSCWGEGVGFGAKQHVFECGSKFGVGVGVAELNFLLRHGNCEGLNGKAWHLVMCEEILVPSPGS